MVVVLRPSPDKEKLDSLILWLQSKNISIHQVVGESKVILGLIGDTSKLDIDMLHALDIVEDVKRVKEPYKEANRQFHPEDTVIKVANTQIGGGSLTMMAGPCSVESEEQIVGIAKAVKEAGATILRGGSFKPRTSPYSFQGLGAEGIELLKIARKETGLPIITEIMEISQLPLFDDIDVIQVGTRNMQNFNLLKELGKQKKPIMLKRGMSATYEELLMSAEYIMSEGNENVILCERGIRTFETYTRNTLDLAAIPVLKKLSHFPIIIDPSHATGKSALVGDLAFAAIAAGADGVMVEVHNDPAKAWCDGAQSITPDTFRGIAKRIIALHEFMKTL
ncbi:MAG: 3-deoxy-7-phosphoheptulonate synthase [Clostridia bacterium]|nr:3-deoxy-7-phosphoheptulonate synthase [Clostridia bacterium]